MYFFIFVDVQAYTFYHVSKTNMIKYVLHSCRTYRWYCCAVSLWNDFVFHFISTDMENTTRIADLPESGPFNQAVQQQQQLANSGNYIPINIHPNPYGTAQPQNIQYPSSTAVFADPPSSASQRLDMRQVKFDTNEIIQDESVKANYLPKAQNMKDYLRDFENQEGDFDHDEAVDTRLKKHRKQKKRVRFMDEFYSKIQIPLIIGFFFFVFHMSIINKGLKTYLNFLPLFGSDGNMTFYGILFKSAVFTCAVFALMEWGADMLSL